MPRLPALILCLAMLACPAPAQDTRPVEQAQQLRDLADYVEQVTAESRNLTERLGQEQVFSAGLQKEIDRLNALAWVQWTPATVLAPNTTYRLPDDQPLNIVVNRSGVTLVGGRGLSSANQRPAIIFLASDGELRGTAFASTLPARADGRLGIGECVRVGDNGGPSATPVRNTRIVNCSAGRVDAFVKLFPDADGVLIERPTTTDALLADGIYVGGAKNVTVRDPDLTAKNENTVRATGDHGVTPERLYVLGGRVVNTGRKAAVNPRNVTGCHLLDVVLSAADLNSAVGVGNGAGLAPGEPGPASVRVEGCTILCGSLTVHQGKGVYFINNLPRWSARSENAFVSLNASAPGNLSDVKVVGNAGQSPVAQKAMIGVQGDRRNIAGYEESNNFWEVKP